MYIYLYIIIYIILCWYNSARSDNSRAVGGAAGWVKKLFIVSRYIKKNSLRWHVKLTFLKLKRDRCRGKIKLRLSESPGVSISNIYYYYFVFSVFSELSSHLWYLFIFNRTNTSRKVKHNLPPWYNFCRFLPHTIHLHRRHNYLFVLFYAHKS